MGSADPPRVVSPIAFYAVVPLHSPYMWAALVAVTMVAAVMLITGASRPEKVLVPLLAVQMFAAATGFAVPARRGHYDLLLTGGAARLHIAATHLLVSMAPGVAAWLVLASVELATTGGPARALAGGSIAAFLMVSMLSWAITVPLPRLSGGILWLLAMVMMLAATDAWRAEVTDVAPRPASAAASLLYAICPFLLVGRSVPLTEAWVLLPGMILSAAAVAAALLWVARMDVALEAAQ